MRMVENGRNCHIQFYSIYSKTFCTFLFASSNGFKKAWIMDFWGVNIMKIDMFNAWENLLKTRALKSAKKRGENKIDILRRKGNCVRNLIVIRWHTKTIAWNRGGFFYSPTFPPLLKSFAVEICTPLTLSRSDIQVCVVQSSLCISSHVQCRICGDKTFAKDCRWQQQSGDFLRSWAEKFKKHF